MNATTNFATVPAQGAAVAHTYAVGAYFSLQDSTRGVILSQLSPDIYGCLLMHQKGEEPEAYTYSLQHAADMTVGAPISTKDRMKLKVASMIICRPSLGYEYYILNNAREDV